MKNPKCCLSWMIQRQHGFSMVELLVALVLSTILLGGIIQLFIGSKQTYRFHDALSRLQENGRFALEIMSHDIRLAGHNDIDNAVRANPAGTNGEDDITLRWRDENGAQTRVFSIGPSGNNTLRTCAAAATSLRLNLNGGGDQELIEGVEQMQILYGICDTNGRVTPPYLNAAGVGANWLNVCSVRIHLLLVSAQDRVVTEPQNIFFPYDQNVNQINPNDLCLRQAFSTTVAIRNRILSTDTTP